MCRCGLHCSNIDGYTRTNTIKYLSLVFIAIFLLHGLITVSISIWLEVLNVVECNFLSNEAYWSPVHIQLSSGCLIVIVCITSVVYNLRWRGNSFVRIFTCLLFIVIFLEILSAIIAGAMHRKSDNKLKQGMTGSAHSINSPGNNDHNEVRCWMRLQQQYSCCGIDNYTTWLIPHNISLITMTFNTTNLDVLNSCNCHGQNGDKCHHINGEYKYSSGCYTELKSKVQFVLTFTRFFGPAFAIVQCFAYFALYVMFTKMYKQSVVAVYQANHNEEKQSCDNLNMFTVS